MCMRMCMCVYVFVYTHIHTYTHTILSSAVTILVLNSPMFTKNTSSIIYLSNILSYIIK